MKLGLEEELKGICSHCLGICDMLLNWYSSLCDTEYFTNDTTNNLHVALEYTMTTSQMGELSFII